MNTTRIYILRHAETDKNLKKNSIKSKLCDLESKNNFVDVLFSSYIYDKDCPLNKCGKLQANIVGEYIEKEDEKIQAIYSSHLLRSIQTANIITKHLNKNKIINFDIDKRLFGGEKKLDNQNNLEQDIRKLFVEIINKHSGFSVLLVTHNHIINVINNLYFNDNLKNKVDNCSLSCIEFKNVKTGDSDYQVIFWNKKIKIKYELI
jgi:Fructose-2,6-bisphosphatase